MWQRATPPLSRTAIKDRRAAGACFLGHSTAQSAVAQHRASSVLVTVTRGQRLQPTWRLALQPSVRHLASPRQLLLQQHSRAFAAASNNNDQSTPSDGDERGKSAEVPAVRGPSAAAPLQETKEVETIESILVRSHRREVMERVGPRAVRYLPEEDATKFLMPDSRLEPWERRWQKVFVALPWAVFAVMLTVPLLLVRTNLPWLQKRAEEDRKAAEARKAQYAVGRVPEFAVVSFSQMPDVLERPFPTLLLLFDPATFASTLFLPFLRDLETALRASGIAVAVAALDLSATPGPPDSFLWEYPRALTPHMQLVLPRAQDGESGVIDYTGRWTAANFAEATRQLMGPYAPDVSAEELARLDNNLEELRDAVFELLFVEDRGGSSVTTPSSEGGGGGGGGSWWRRWLRGGGSGGGGKAAAEAEAVAAETSRREAVAEAAKAIDLSAGLDRALASCREAAEQLSARA